MIFILSIGLAFKFRGASNAVMRLTEQDAQKGVVTHSSGNHAQALALAAKKRGIPAYIVMPNNAPEVKKEAVRGYGAKIIECEPTQEAREAMVRRWWNACNFYFWLTLFILAGCQGNSRNGCDVDPSVREPSRHPRPRHDRDGITRADWRAATVSGCIDCTCRRRRHALGLLSGHQGIEPAHKDLCSRTRKGQRRVSNIRIKDSPVQSSRNTVGRRRSAHESRRGCILHCPRQGRACVYCH